jgi:hypothetical protein
MSLNGAKGIDHWRHGDRHERKEAGGPGTSVSTVLGMLRTSTPSVAGCVNGWFVLKAYRAGTSKTTWDGSVHLTGSLGSARNPHLCWPWWSRHDGTISIREKSQNKRGSCFHAQVSSPCFSTGLYRCSCLASLQPHQEELAEAELL